MLVHLFLPAFHSKFWSNSLFGVCAVLPERSVRQIAINDLPLERQIPQDTRTFSLHIQTLGEERKKNLVNSGSKIPKSNHFWSAIPHEQSPKVDSK